MMSCQKQTGIDPNQRIFISADTVKFDTVFVSTGSVTQKVKLINNNEQDLVVSSIQLMGGAQSAFIINIDGTPGPSVTNVKIPANDSLYIFIKVLAPQGNSPLPFILEDSIRINYNNHEDFIQLNAWGQNAHFLTSQTITGQTTWSGPLPYVIYGKLTIDTNAVLTIEAGTHIYIHADAAIFVNGTLKVLGDAADSQHVYFSGDRLDLPYSKYPGSWQGIYFQEPSVDNEMNYADIENGNHSVVSQGPGMNGRPKLTIQQCFINNSLAEGILGIQTSIRAVNCLISNCGQNIVLGLGGEYNFEYCTVVGYSNDLLFHQQPVLSVSNSGSDGTQVFTSDLNAHFINCIFWGSSGVADEMVVSREGNTKFDVLLDHSILKQQNYPANIDSNVLILNQDPMFISTNFPENNFSFQLQAGSPAIGRGSGSGVLIDLNGSLRPSVYGDLGCYERQ